LQVFGACVDCLQWTALEQRNDCCDNELDNGHSSSFSTLRLLVYTVARAMPLERKTDHTAQVDITPSSPDIYYIILDAYTRTDVMKDKLGYDNNSFVNSLQDMGFYVG